MSYLQEKALNLLGNAANFISSEMSNGSVDSKLVQSIGTSLFSGIGNVLNAASSEAGTDNEDLEEREEQPKVVTQGDQVDSKAAKEKVSKGLYTLFISACNENIMGIMPQEGIF